MGPKRILSGSKEIQLMVGNAGIRGAVKDWIKWREALDSMNRDRHRLRRSQSLFSAGRSNGSSARP